MSEMRQNCGGDCGGCMGCGGCGQALALTEGELAMLERLAQTPFLPVAGTGDPDAPVYREETDRPAEEYGRILLGLRLKGLVRLDYDLPLTNFDYSAYQDCRYRGSMALTGLGQRAIELLEIQGVEK